MSYPPKGKDIAEALGISPGRVSQLRKEGLPTDSIASAIAWYKRRVDPGRSFGARRGARLADPVPAGETRPPHAGDESGDQPPRDVVSYEEARRRREVAEATTAELRLAEAAGTLVKREAINRMLFTSGRVMRDQLLAMAPRLAATLAPITDAKTIEQRIDEEIRVALRAFAQQLRAGGFGE